MFTPPKAQGTNTKKMDREDRALNAVTLIAMYCCVTVLSVYSMGCGVLGIKTGYEQSEALVEA